MPYWIYSFFHILPDSKVHVTNMGPTWVLSAPGGPHVGPTNFVIRVVCALSSMSKVVIFVVSIVWSTCCMQPRDQNAFLVYTTRVTAVGNLSCALCFCWKQFNWWSINMSYHKPHIFHYGTFNSLLQITKFNTNWFKSPSKNSNDNQKHEQW